MLHYRRRCAVVTQEECQEGAAENLLLSGRPPAGDEVAAAGSVLVLAP